MSKELHREHLQSIATNEPSSIRACVADEALDYYSISNFFNDLSTHGCVSGMVTSLIYYHQTHLFFDTHYEEIEEIRLQYEEEIGIPLSITHDLKNTLAWFAFEQVAHQISNELNL